MCGIVGFFSKKRFDRLEKDLGRASASLAHRGPDDAGLFVDPGAGVGLAHRRLSILDLSDAGRQPMTGEDGAARIVYNGEVYNFQSIRSELETLGRRFRSRTDTEVVLKAHRQWGPACLERFIGMFAMAIWDGERRRLFLARDRLGIKPLYYYHRDGVFLFGSELKALMAFGVFEKRVDPEAVPLFLHYNYIPTPKTIFRHARKLPPGHFMTVDRDGIEIRRYWRPPDASRPAPIDEEAALDELERLLTRAVTDRLISDAPLGALLSGGVDSSLVAALMQKTSREPIRTFTIGFKEKAYNEAHYAARIARHLGARHTELRATPGDALSVIPRLPEIFDEPFADSSAVPTLLVSHLTRSRVTVALSGDGGDEQFCGYGRYWITRAMAHRFAPLPGVFRKMLSVPLGRAPISWVEACYKPLRPLMPGRLQVANFREKWKKLLAAMRCDDLSDLYRAAVCVWSGADLLRLTGSAPARGGFETAFRETEGAPLLSRLMHVDQRTYLLDDMLVKVDRASMAHGLEVRVPLLDHRVVEYSAALPDAFKFKNGDAKHPLKKLLARYMPPALFERPKMGFGVPIDAWLRCELRDLLTDYLSPARLDAEGLFDSTRVEAMVRSHMDGRENHHHQLWALLMWEMWRERWRPSI